MNLINCKNKALFGKVSVGGFTLSLRQSNLRMALRGALDTLSFLDYSEYPHTVIEERVEYGEGNYLLKPKLDSKGMVRFDVELLKTVNNAGKDLLVKADVQGIEVYYVQQPVLRVLTYLTTQFMSSLSQSDIKK